MIPRTPRTRRPGRPAGTASGDVDVRRRRALPARWRPEAWAGAVVRLATYEAAGGIVLTAAVVGAVVWANAGGYAGVWDARLRWGVLPASQFADVRGWVDNGLMTVFFLAVGVEVGRERTHGSLQGTRNALLPVVAALGGMAGAAVVYLATTGTIAAAGGGAPDVLHGWGVPMATDVAFTLGAMALLGRRVPAALRVFVLALAVADDVASVVVLAVVSSAGVRPLPLGGALACLAAVAVARRWVTVAWWPYLVAVVAVWLLLAWADVEPTLAGAFVGILVPCTVASRHAPLRPAAEQAAATPRLPAPRRSASAPRRSASAPRRSASASRRSASAALESVVGPISIFAVLPVFALANTGVMLDQHVLGNPASRSVVVSVVVARLLGKTGGITLGVVALVRFSVLRLPAGVRWAQLVGAAAMCGMGFTVPLLFATTAFAGHPPLVSASQVGLLAGTVLAFAVGAGVLVAAGRRGSRRPLPGGRRRRRRRAAGGELDGRGAYPGAGPAPVGQATPVPPSPQ